MVSAEFNQAVEDARKLTKKPDNTDLLQLYGLFKQAMQDPPFDQSPQPGTFDLKGKAKRKAWQKVVDDGVTPEQADQKYVAFVEELKGKYGFDASKAPETIGEED